MKKILTLLILFFVTIFGTESCLSHNHHKTKVVKVRAYKVLNTATAANDDFIYYYIMINNSNGSTGYYSYESVTPVTNFTSVQWTPSSTLPQGITSSSSYQELDEPLSELPSEIEVDMEANGSVTEVESEGSEGGEGSGDSGGDSGGSDGGGGDSGGGGDGGGGD